ITDTDGTGFLAGSTDSHHVDILTNGWIDEAEKTDDLRVGRIMSTANDVTLHSPRRIIDARNDGIDSEAHVRGRNITRTAGDSGIPGRVIEKRGTGGFGTPDNFLEINVAVLYAGNSLGLGVLTANDVAVASKANTQGIFITEVVRGLESQSLLGGKGPL